MSGWAEALDSTTVQQAHAAWVAQQRKIPLPRLMTKERMAPMRESATRRRKRLVPPEWRQQPCEECHRAAWWVLPPKRRDECSVHAIDTTEKHAGPCRRCFICYVAALEARAIEHEDEVSGMWEKIRASGDKTRSVLHDLDAYRIAMRAQASELTRLQIERDQLKVDLDACRASLG